MKGLNIKEIRLKLGMNQTEFAKELGVTKNTVSNWEKKDKINSKTIKIIEDFVNKLNLKDLGYVNLGDVTGSNNKISNKNFLNEPKENYDKTPSKITELEEKIKKLEIKNQQLTEELLSCKDKLIDTLTKNK